MDWTVINRGQGCRCAPVRRRRVVCRGQRDPARAGQVPLEADQKSAKSEGAPKKISRKAAGR
eukprot:8479049-Alexandrium_andersonii.AAC.1